MMRKRSVLVGMGGWELCPCPCPARPLVGGGGGGQEKREVTCSDGEKLKIILFLEGGWGMKCILAAGWGDTGPVFSQKTKAATRNNGSNPLSESLACTVPPGTRPVRGLGQAFTPFE